MESETADEDVWRVFFPYEGRMGGRFYLNLRTLSSLWLAGMYGGFLSP